MSDKIKVERTSGVSFAGLLQLAFIVLKLCKVIAWTWIQVFIPTFVSLGVTIIVLLVVLIVNISSNR